MEEEHTQALTYLKAFTDAQRLRILGRLAEQPARPHELATQLNTTEIVVRRHLAVLTEVGIVASDGHDGNFRLHTAALHTISRTLLPALRPPVVLSDYGLTAGERKVMRTFVRDDRLVKLPDNFGAKHVVILRWLAEKFTPEVRYPEHEVNAIIGRYHEDFATLRRALVDWSVMQRERGMYWRVEHDMARDQA